MVEITEANGMGDVEIGSQIFSQEEADKIHTRIKRNSFSGERSHIRGHGGLTILRDGDKLILASPAGFPKESWSYREWVEQSGGWTVYAEGTQEEWMEAFDSAP